MAADPNRSVLLFGDEADIHLNPHLTRGWYIRGKPRTVPAAGTNQRRALFGALNPVSGKLLIHTVSEKTGEVFVNFLRCVLRANPGKHVYFVIDNGPIHTAKFVAQFLEQEVDQLTIIWLPRYSPNLNLIERVWGHLKRSTISNIFYGTVGRLIVAIARAVRTFNYDKATITRLVFKHWGARSAA